MTATRRLLVAVALASAVLLVGGGSWLVATDDGSRRLSTVLQAWLPQLTLTGLKGNLRDGLGLEQLTWSDDGFQLRLEAPKLKVDLSALWLRGLRFTRLEAESLLITLDQEDPPATTGQPPTLPAINLPLGVSADALRLGRLSIVDAGKPLHIDAIQARLGWTGSILQVHQLSAELLETRLSGKASIRFRANYPLQAELQATQDLGGNPVQAEVVLGGDLRGLLINMRLDQPIGLRGSARLDVLGAGLPIDADLSMSQPWPTAAGDIENVTVKLRGDMLRVLRGQLGGQLRPVAALGDTPLELAADLQYRDDQLLIDGLTFGRPQQQLRADCRQQLTPPLHLECAGELALEQLSPWLAPAAASMRTPWRLRLDFDDPGWQLNLDLEALTGHWRQQPLAGSLKLAVGATALDIHQLELRIGANRVAATGSLNDSNQPLRLTLGAGDLGQLDPRLGGTLSGQLTSRLTAGHSLDQADISGRINGQRLSWQNWRIGRAVLDLAVHNAAFAPSEARLQLDDVAGQGDLSLRLNGTRAAHELALQASHSDHGDADFACRGEAGQDEWALSCPQLALTWRSADTPVEFNVEQPLALHWRGDLAALDLEPFCLAGDGARLCIVEPLSWRDGTLGPLNLGIDRFALAWFNNRLPPDWQFTAASRMDGHLAVSSWQPLVIDADLAAVDVEAQWSGAETPVALVYDALSMVLKGNDQQFDITAHATSTQLGNIHGSLRIDQPRTSRSLDGKVTIGNLQLAAIAWAFPEAQDLHGSIAGDIAIAGTTAAPRLEGRAAADGGARLPLLPDPLRFELAADFNTDRARLDGEFASGDGSATLAGNLYWPEQAGLQADIRLDGQQLTLTPLVGSTVTASPSLRLRWNRPAGESPAGTATATGLSLRGTVNIDQANIVLQELPENAVKVSPDAKLVGAEAIAEPNPLPIDVQLGLALGDRFQFQGFGAEARLSGVLDLAYSNGEPLQAQGEITIPKGRYHAYGQRLDVRRGSVLFAGDATSPDLDIEAVRDLNRRDIVVGIRVTGNPRNPYAQLFSEPAMPETTIAYYLLTGKPPGEGTAGSDIVAENILTSLGLAGAENPATRLAERIGIRDLQLGTGTGLYGTEAQISAYLLPRLYVRYGVSLEQDAASLTLQYQLAPRLFLEAVSGIDNALDLLYTFERPRPGPAAGVGSDGE